MLFVRMLLVFGLLYFISRAVFAGFPPQVRGVSISNAHLMAEGQGRVYRGSQPLGKEQQLLDLGITHVLIFKNQIKDEVIKESRAFRRLSAGSTQGQVHVKNIPFAWKDKVPEETQCQQIVEALDYIAQVYQSSNQAIYFHCTVGEDRTGLLAGLFRQMIEQKKTSEIFSQELCARGYEAGNSAKPPHVVEAIRTNLTPIFLKMSKLIVDGEVSLQRRDPKVCKNIGKMRVQSQAWKCPSRQ